MRHTAFFPFLFFLLAADPVQAQQDPSARTVDTIQYFKGNERYFLNGKRVNVLQLAPRLNQFPSSALELKAYRKRATVGTIALLTGISAGVIAFTRLKKDTHFFTPYTVTLLVGDAIGIPLMISANRRLKRSVKLYNQELLLR